MKRVLRYLKGTIYHGLHLKCNSPVTLHVCSDADWVGNRDDYTSTSAYIVYLGTNPLFWSSKKQRFVARSSTEAKYQVVTTTVAERIWLLSLFQELGITLVESPTIHYDNVGATYLCSNSVFHSRMKHIAIDFHFVRDRVSKGLLNVSHVSNS